MEQKACCLPVRNQNTALSKPGTGPDTGSAAAASAEGAPCPPSPAKEVVAIPGGFGLVGTNRPFIAVDGEGPLRRVRLKPFLMDRTAVTNAEFARFVDDTGYRTDAERFGWSFAFHTHLKDPDLNKAGPPVLGTALAGAEWWRKADGANWRLINGRGSEGDFHPDHPVVQVSRNDAQAFAAWSGGRLPTEAEWEHAARGGQGDVLFPWGDQAPNDTDFFPCNIWQGNFPTHDTGADAYTATAPARSFEPNAFGLFNMCGNTWEWTADAFKIRSLRKTAKKRAQEIKGFKTLKGGSFLCHRSYCFRYRIAARTGVTADSGMTHCGFRLVYDPGGDL